MPSSIRYPAGAHVAFHALDAADATPLGSDGKTQRVSQAVQLTIGCI